MTTCSCCRWQTADDVDTCPKCGEASWEDDGAAPAVLVAESAEEATVEWLDANDDGPEPPKRRRRRSKRTKSADGGKE